MVTYEKLADVANIIDSLHKTPKYSDDGFPMVRVTDIKGGYLKLNGTKRVTKNTYEKFTKRYKPQFGDVIFSRVGSYGNSCFVNDSIKFCLGQNTVAFRPKINPFYFFYCINSNFVKNQIESLVGGASQQTISLKNLGIIKIPIFNIIFQQKIASILSAYDDLIENNIRRIKILEEMAQAIYKEWFVNFRFPSYEKVKFVNSPLGKIPEGWEVMNIEDIADTLGGGTPSTKKEEYWVNGNIDWFTPSDLTKNISLVLLDSVKKINDLGLKKSSAKLFPPKTIMMTSRATIGYFGIINKESCTNQGFINIIPKKDEWRYYILYNLMNRKEEIIGNANGATYKEIIKSRFRKMSILLPEFYLVKEFQKLIEHIIEEIKNLTTKNQNLSKTRDLLLPKLISGEVEV
ncbi:MAG: restriction endonuclease subunit S [Ignavibacteriaceae bacterium]